MKVFFFAVALFQAIFFNLSPSLFSCHLLLFLYFCSIICPLPWIICSSKRCCFCVPEMFYTEYTNSLATAM